jgi:hypothetical protein
MTTSLEALRAAALDHKAWRDSCKGDRPTEAGMRVDPEQVLAILQQADRMAVLEDLMCQKTSAEFERIFDLPEDGPDDEFVMTADFLHEKLDAEIARRREAASKDAAA